MRVSVGLLHVLHGGDGRGQPFGPCPYRQRVHLSARQEIGGLEVPVVHGVARRVSVRVVYSLTATMAEAILLAIPRGHKKSEPDYRKLVVSSGTGVSVL